MIAHRNYHRTRMCSLYLAVPPRVQPPATFAE